jgi:hypothetical protein
MSTTVNTTHADTDAHQLSPDTNDERGLQNMRDGDAESDAKKKKKMPCWRRIGIITHFLRVFNWRLADLEPMPFETKAMLRKNVTNTTLQSFLVWRRSMLYIAIPVLILNALAALAEDVEEVIMSEMLNDLGDFLYFLPSTASTILLIATTAALCYWTASWRRSTRILRIGWIISFVLPFVPAMAPMNALVVSCEDWSSNSTSVTESTANTTTTTTSTCDETTRAGYQLEVSIYEYQMAATYAFQLFPIVAMFPWGMSRAALKIRGLLPQSMLSSWILVIMAPFQSVVFLLGLILLIQLGGNGWLFLGTICFASAPWMFVSRRRFFLCNPTEDSEKQVDRTMVFIGRLVKLGIIFYFVGALLTPENALHLLFEGVGRSLVSAVVFGDVLFRMTITNWRLEQDRRAHNSNGDAIDAVFGEIEYSISKVTSKKKRDRNKANHAEINSSSTVGVNSSALSQP